MKGYIVFDWHEFITTPIYQFFDPLDEKRIAMKVITGYKFDNEYYKFTNAYGDLFSFSISKCGAEIGSIKHVELIEKFGKDVRLDKIYYINIWNGTGMDTIYKESFIIKNAFKDTIPEEIANKIDMLVCDYSRGIYYCNDCGKRITKKEIGGRYFAGKYCKDCWIGKTGTYKGKGGWQKLEKEETYE